jgi:hypothetical protein
MSNSEARARLDAIKQELKRDRHTFFWPTIDLSEDFDFLIEQLEQAWKERDEFKAFAEEYWEKNKDTVAGRLAQALVEYFEEKK